MAPGGIADHVFLDATGIARELFARRFPTVSAACAAAGIDPSAQPIPVAPAAHYHCGGVLTDLDGRTTVAGLFAIGEVARTGLHGANRLASNSLLEGLVMGERAAAAVGAEVRSTPAHPAELMLTAVPGSDPAGRTALQSAMSAGAGIGRDLVGLSAADRRRRRRADRPRAGGRCGPLVGGDREPGPGGVGTAGRRGHPDRIPRLPRPQRPPGSAPVVGAVGGRAVQRRRTGRHHQRTLFGGGVISAPLRSALAAAGLDPDEVNGVIDTALAEDLRDGPDVTTTATVPADQSSVAAVTPRQPGVLAGGPVALAVFEIVGAQFGWGVRRDPGAGRRDADPR